MYEETKFERGPLVAGVSLIAAGAYLALARFDVLDQLELAPFWPLVVIAAGAAAAALGERPKALRTGAWIALVGCWLLANTLELGGFRWWTSWPLMVMLVGAFQLAWPDEGEERSGGLMTLVIGTWLLISTRGYFGLGWRDSWPILLVLAGISMVLKAATTARRAARRQS